MRELLRNKVLDQQLKEKGYAVVDFLDEHSTCELLNFYEVHTGDGAKSGFHASMFHTDTNYRQNMDNAIMEAFSEGFKNHFVEGYQQLYANFMVKEVGADSEMRMHQDWTYVDEDLHDSYAIWVPLLDLTDSNGVFTVFPYSHQLNNKVRGPGITCPFEQQWRNMDAALFKPIYLKAGQAVIWNHRLAHFSPPNMSDGPRIAATSIVVPEGAEVLHYFKPSADEPVEQYAVNHDFFMQYEISKRPNADLLATIDYEINSLTVEELNKLGNQNGGETSHIIRKPSRKVFHAEAMENEFNQKGYVTLDLLDEQKFTELQELLADLNKSTDKTNVNIQSEYELSFFNRDVDYRRMVLRRINDFFKPLLDPILDNYEPLIVNLFNKKPGSGEVPIHQNWTFVDESKYTSVSVWIPLCDVSRLNGTLEVVPKTHNTLTNYRSPSIPWVFEGLEEVLKEKYLQPLELKKGQIGILDDAILHWSSENNSDHDRATIQLIMKPVEAMPLHYYCEDLDRGELSVYKVDSDFFASFEMHDRPKDVPVVATEHFSYHKMNEDELVDRIS